MVLEIRLSNFFSIKDEVVLDMQAASIQTKKAKELEENSNSEALASQVHSSFASSLKVSNMNILLNSIKLRY